MTPPVDDRRHVGALILCHGACAVLANRDNGVRRASEAVTFQRSGPRMNHDLLNNLLLGLPVMVGCLLLQALLISAAISYYKQREHRLNEGSYWNTSGVITGVMMLLTVGNLARIALWALLFRLLGEFEEYGDAVYHSAVNFATLGYGDIVMSVRHRLLGPLEAVNGALMIGASTATLMVAFQRWIQKAAG
jgi:hypothetical protein